jgi:hypothetical protein
MTWSSVRLTAEPPTRGFSRQALSLAQTGEGGARRRHVGRSMSLAMHTLPSPHTRPKASLVSLNEESRRA